MKRDKVIDIIKGICVCLMVAGHSGISRTARDFIYLFHMPIFIIASGYFWKNSDAENIKSLLNFIIRKIKKLWIPYVGVVSAYALLHNLFYKINFYTDNPVALSYLPNLEMVGKWDLQTIITTVLKSFVFRDEANTQLSSAMWFVGCLFQTILLYACVNYFIQHLKLNLKLQFICAIIFLMFGYWCQCHELWIFGFARAMSCYSLFFLGYVIRKCKAFYDKTKSLIAVGMISLFILVISTGKVECALASHVYSNPLTFVLEGVAGWFFIYLISKCLVTTFFASIFSVIGQYTLWIVAGQYIAFKFVNFIGTEYYNHPSCLIAGYSASYSQIGFWWIAYCFAGITLPVLAALLFSKIKMILKRDM